MELSQKNKLFNKISDAAKVAISHPRNIELTNFIGTGPSIRARARLALAAAFLVSAPTLFIGVMRTENVAEHAALLSEYDDYWKQILGTKLAIKDLDLAIWAYINEGEFENAQATHFASERLSKSVAKLAIHKPQELDLGPPGFFEGFASRLDGLIKKAIATNSSLAPARLSIMTLARELNDVEERVILTAKEERNAAFNALSTVGRDQLILFLVLLFAIPLFVGFIPGWIVAPLLRLRQVSAKIEAGKIREIGIYGKDEVAKLARTLKDYFIRNEDLAQKKSSKIFEMRNILRQAIGKISQPILIVDESLKINYTNEAMSHISGIPTHQMEGNFVTDFIFCSHLKKSLQRAFEGHLAEEFTKFEVVVPDGREYDLLAKLGVVRNRDGEISRAIVVFHEKAKEQEST